MTGLTFELTRSIKQTQHYLLVLISLLVWLIPTDSMDCRRGSLQIRQGDFRSLMDGVRQTNNLKELIKAN